MPAVCGKLESLAAKSVTIRPPGRLQKLQPARAGVRQKIFRPDRSTNPPVSDAAVILFTSLVTRHMSQLLGPDVSRGKGRVQKDVGHQISAGHSHHGHLWGRLVFVCKRPLRCGFRWIKLML